MPKPWARDSSGSLADTSTADDHECLAAELQACGTERPFSGPHLCGKRGNTARRRQRQQYGELRDGRIEHVGVFVHKTPRRCGLFLVDPVVAHPEPRDHPAARQCVVKRTGVFDGADDHVTHAAFADLPGQRRFVSGAAMHWHALD